ncbi:MAG: hypothetical protein RI911_947 [Candidatus Parcubacteria bacterium]|jgi:PKD repeat protein
MRTIIALLALIMSLSFAEALIAELPDDYADETKLYCPSITQTLRRGMRDANTGGQVSELQVFLSDYFNLDEEEYITGFFGRGTQRYVADFQRKYNLPAFGVVGTLTRAKIAEICRGGETGLKKCVVSGCSGQLCTEEGSGLATTCEYREEYACYKKATCTRQPSGQCGWTMTSELKQCLNPNPKPCERAAPPRGCYWKEKPWATKCEADLVCDTPVANQYIKALPVEGIAPLTTTFVTNVMQGNVEVNYGDGSSERLLQVSGYERKLLHTFTRPGAYTVTLSEVNTCRGTDTVNCALWASRELASVKVYVKSATVSPAFRAEPASGGAPLTVTFSTPAGDEESYSVEFGDGTSGAMNVSGGGSLRKVVHTYANPGVYNAVLMKQYRCDATPGTTCLALAAQEVGRATITVQRVGAGPVSLKTQSIVSNQDSSTVYVSQRTSGLTESNTPNAHIDWGDGTVERVQCEQLSYPTSFMPVQGATQSAIAVYVPQRCDHGYMSILNHNYVVPPKQLVNEVKEYTIRIMGDYGESARNTIRIWNGMQTVTNY